VCVCVCVYVCVGMCVYVIELVFQWNSATMTSRGGNATILQN
jgi:hypothetical protein